MLQNKHRNHCQFWFAYACQYRKRNENNLVNTVMEHSCPESDNRLLMNRWVKHYFFIFVCLWTM